MLVSHFRLRSLRMAEDNSVKGKRALNIILASMCNFGQLPNTVFFKLFDTKVLPILLYGAELWDFQTRTGIERIQKGACKRNMCLNEQNARCGGSWRLWSMSIDHEFVHKMSEILVENFENA